MTLPKAISDLVQQIHAAEKRQGEVAADIQATRQRAAEAESYRKKLQASASPDDADAVRAITDEGVRQQLYTNKITELERQAAELHTTMGRLVAQLHFDLSSFKTEAKAPYEAAREEAVERVNEQFRPLLELLGELVPDYISVQHSVSSGVRDPRRYATDLLAWCERFTKFQGPAGQSRT